MEEIDKESLEIFVEKNNDLFVIKKKYIIEESATEYYTLIIEN